MDNEYIFDEKYNMNIKWIENSLSKEEICALQDKVLSDLVKEFDFDGDNYIDLIIHTYFLTNDIDNGPIVCVCGYNYYFELEYVERPEWETILEFDIH